MPISFAVKRIKKDRFDAVFGLFKLAYQYQHGKHHTGKDLKYSQNECYNRCFFYQNVKKTRLPIAKPQKIFYNTFNDLKGE